MKSVDFQAIFLSPHFDDVVLSCGGTINLMKRKNIPSTVLTIFAGSPEGNLSTLASWMHKEWKLPYEAIEYRNEENQNALSFLNSKDFSLNFKSSIYRKYSSTGEFLYALKENIFNGNWSDEKSLVKDIVIECQQLLVGMGDLFLIAPLGAGNHIDHILTHIAATQLASKLGGVRLVFYEDLPYAIKPNSLSISIDRLNSPLKTSIFTPLIKDDMLAKQKASNQYQSQLKVNSSSIGVSIEEVINYGNELGRESQFLFSERFWVSDSQTEEYFRLAIQ